MPPLSPDDARALLKQHDLRATAARVEVLVVLARQDHPLSHTELLRALGAAGGDQATVYRTLTKLTESGVTRVVSHAGGMARYELVPAADQAEEHAHPHFLCTDCGAVSCLSTVWLEAPRVERRWRSAVSEATLQFQGRCPECRSR